MSFEVIQGDILSVDAPLNNSAARDIRFLQNGTHMTSTDVKLAEWMH